jgi:hypothetical protein
MGCGLLEKMDRSSGAEEIRDERFMLCEFGLDRAELPFLFLKKAVLILKCGK